MDCNDSFARRCNMEKWYIYSFDIFVCYLSNIKAAGEVTMGHFTNSIYGGRIDAWIGMANFRLSLLHRNFCDVFYYGNDLQTT